MLDYSYQLYLVTDENQDILVLRHVVEQAVLGGVTIVQLRCKHASTAQFLSRAKALKQVLESYNIPLIINDRVDIALAVDAEGVHLGQSDGSVMEARTLLGDDKIIGLSVESEQQLLAAQKLPVDYLGMSAIFSTPTKQDLKKIWGIEGLKFGQANSQLPLVAIGGINSCNISQVADTGVSGIAVVSAITQADDPRSAAAYLKSLI